MLSSLLSVKWPIFFLLPTEYVVFFEESLSEPNTWVQSTTVPGNQPWAVLSLSPYGNYRFKVLAKNKHGESDRSPPSKHYETDPAGEEAPSAVEVGVAYRQEGTAVFAHMELLMFPAPMSDAGYGLKGGLQNSVLHTQVYKSCRIGATAVSTPLFISIQKKQFLFWCPFAGSAYFF